MNLFSAAIAVCGNSNSQVKCTTLKAYFNSVNGKMSRKIYHIQATNEDDEHLIETVYYIHLKLVLYENFYIEEMMFI